MAISHDINPIELNEVYESLMDVWDRLPELPHPDVVDIVNAVFEQFQDWFWGQYEVWDMSELPTHVDRYNTIQPVIMDWVGQVGTQDEPYQEEPLEPGQVIHLPAEYVYGTVHPIQPAGLSKGMLWTIAGLLATIFLSKAT